MGLPVSGGEHWGNDGGLGAGLARGKEGGAGGEAEVACAPSALGSVGGAIPRGEPADRYTHIPPGCSGASAVFSMKHCNERAVYKDQGEPAGLMACASFGAGGGNSGGQLPGGGGERGGMGSIEVGGIGLAVPASLSYAGTGGNQECSEWIEL